MKSVILFTVSAMACLLPILSVEGQLQTAWKVVSSDGRTGKLGFISANGLLLQQLPTVSYCNNCQRATTPLATYSFFPAAAPSAVIILDPETLSSQTDQFNWILAPLTSNKSIPETKADKISQTTCETTTETVRKTTTETATETTTEIVPATTETITETTREALPETTTEIIPATTEIITETTTEAIPETTTEIIPATTETITQTPTETIYETTTDTYIESTTTTTPTTTTEKADDGPVPVGVTVGPDGLRYFKSIEKLSQTDCRTYCHGFKGGFSLAIAKTKETMEALRNHGNVMVDMSISRNPRTGEVTFIWGDGTELDPSLTRPDLREPVLNSGRKTSVIVMYRNGRNVLLDDVPSTYPLPCLCQGTR